MRRIDRYWKPLRYRRDGSINIDAGTRYDADPLPDAQVDHFPK